MPLVTLLTDFGLRDGYVAQMKGVILSRCPDCRIIDLSHLVGRHNIAEGAYLLQSSVGYFPTNTFHVAVVDPGVGSSRQPIIVACKSATLVGPDNGLLTLAADKLVLEQVYRIDQSKLQVRSVSSTFHGRDVFAATAAELARGISPGLIGTRLRSMMRLKVLQPKFSKHDVRCTILHVDVFGNIITNAPSSSTLAWFSKGRILRLRTREKSVAVKCAETYTDGDLGELLVLRGSQGYVEVAARERNASELLGVGASDALVIGMG